MKTASKYRIKQLGHLLKIGQARIDGQTCDGDRWPEGNHYWIISVFPEAKTYHVRVSDRPSWSKLAPKG